MCLTLSLLTWRAWGQAPDDYDSTCRTEENADDRAFPSSWMLMLDTYDYSQIIPGLWLEESFDGDGDSVSQ